MGRQLHVFLMLNQRNPLDESHPRSQGQETPKMKNRQKGFSLIELLIVVSIILVIAAVAIPNLLSARVAANEASAVGALRTVTSSSVMYMGTFGNGYAPSLGVLGGKPGDTLASCDEALLIDAVLSNNGSGNTSQKAGYNFTYTPSDTKSGQGPSCSTAGSVAWQMTAVPTSVGQSGKRGFYVDQTGVITFTTDGSVASNQTDTL
jgi:type IV pilus assembly protein PilA